MGMAVLSKAKLGQANFLWQRETSALCVFTMSKAGLFKLARLQLHSAGWAICAEIALSETEIDELYDFSHEYDPTSCDEDEDPDR